MPVSVDAACNSILFEKFRCPYPIRTACLGHSFVSALIFAVVVQGGKPPPPAPPG